MERKQIVAVGVGVGLCLGMSQAFGASGVSQLDTAVTTVRAMLALVGFILFIAGCAGIGWSYANQNFGMGFALFVGILVAGVIIGNADAFAGLVGLTNAAELPRVVVEYTGWL